MMSSSDFAERLWAKNAEIELNIAVLAGEVNALDQTAKILKEQCQQVLLLAHSRPFKPQAAIPISYFFLAMPLREALTDVQSLPTAK